ncbi:hypothetical protein [Xanthobacter aminoxidans]|uniref:hypothetical protein n=1 Tax=Xanthobacter aminoxidans TaxID=186280 RepID=UPI002022E261|nr:hypothetical protein [Xanthobacter aminoxidans]MCL8382117.1 hypothetical protein [Xanthobacter aminoxidans]
MADLHEQLEEAEARVAYLKRRIATAPCAEVGHRWKHIGGKNCGCENGSCSVPVHECTVCGDCDYGENAEAEETRAECASRKGGIDA